MSCLVSVGFEAQSRTRIVDRVHRKISYEDADVARFRASVGLKNVETHQYVLPPERHVGAEEVEEDGEPFEVKMPKLVTKPQEPFGEGRRLAGAVEKNLRGLADGF